MPVLHEQLAGHQHGTSVGVIIKPFYQGLMYEGIESNQFPAIQHRGLGLAQLCEELLCNRT